MTYIQTLDLRCCQAVKVIPNGELRIGIPDVVKRDTKGLHVRMSHPSINYVRKLHFSPRHCKDKRLPTYSGSTLLQARPPESRSSDRSLLPPFDEYRFGYAESALLWVPTADLRFSWEPVDELIKISKKPTYCERYFDELSLQMQVGINGFPIISREIYVDNKVWQRDEIVSLYAASQVPLVQMHYMSDANDKASIVCDSKGAMLELSLHQGALVARAVTRDLFRHRLERSGYGMSNCYYEVQRQMNTVCTH